MCGARSCSLVSHFWYSISVLVLCFSTWHDYSLQCHWCSRVYLVFVSLKQLCIHVSGICVVCSAYANADSATLEQHAVAALHRYRYLTKGALSSFLGLSNYQSMCVLGSNGPCLLDPRAAHCRVVFHLNVIASERSGARAGPHAPRAAQPRCTATLTGAAASSPVSGHEQPDCWPPSRRLGTVSVRL